MHVVIVGCGRVGSNLASHLAAGGQSVAVVDRREAAFGRLDNAPDVQRVVGIGFDRDVLRSAGIERADALAATTSGDNSNIVIARVAAETFQVPKVVARIYDPARAAIYQRLGVSTVATSQWTAGQMLTRIGLAGDGVEWLDPTGSLRVKRWEVPDERVGSTIASIPADLGLVIAVSRLGSTHLAEPSLVLQHGDVAYVAEIRKDTTS